jgi:hypothetical protein
VRAIAIAETVHSPKFRGKVLAVPAVVTLIRSIEAWTLDQSSIPEEVTQNLSIPILQAINLKSSKRKL